MVRLKDQVRTVCVDTVGSELSFDDARDQLDRFEAQLMGRIEEHGFRAVGHSAVDEAWRRIASREDSLYDPHTGDPRTEEIVRVRRELMDELGCDATLHSRLAIVRAPLMDGKARWDGAKRQVGGGAGSTGWVSALSLWISMRDRDDEEIYFRAGGIQLLGQLEPRLVRASFRPVSEESILTDKLSNLEGIDSCLELFREVPAPVPH